MEDFMCIACGRHTPHRRAPDPHLGDSGTYAIFNCSVCKRVKLRLMEKALHIQSGEEGGDD